MQLVLHKVPALYWPHGPTKPLQAHAASLHKVLAVTHAITNEGGHYSECNLLIRKLVLHVAECDSDLHVARVESKANIADGPTRNFLDDLIALNAQFASPVLPSWAVDVWHID